MTACERPGCDGTIEDGYCDTCGMAAAPRAATLPSPSPAPDFSTSTALSTPTGAWPGTGSTAASRPSRRGTGRSSSRSVRGRLGAGLVEVPPVARVDPASALLSDPRVAESKRFCSRCGRPVGRGRDGQPGRVEGFCPHDGARFSFTPKLTPGTLVGGQYEVRGCLAHGGLGWVYLAQDHNVNDRWVVLKGLLDSGDADAMAAAVAERRFLAEVDHPSIVTIVNFVQHPDDDGSPVGYIVMEYVGGSSLKDLLDARRRPDGTFEPLPVGQAIAYALEVLPALGYLHSRGLVYCDFKPDNVIQYEQQLKLIDLGAVIHQDDHLSAVFGTVGYQAPEIATDGPSPMSDVHTVGRSLAVLALGLPPAHRGVPTPLPDAHPVLLAHPSFDRLLRRATDPDPLRRFASTDEMADQLSGVLHEVLSAQDGVARPIRSTLFGPSRGVFAPGLLLGGARPGRPRPADVAAQLPVPLVDATDPAAGLLAASATVDRAEVLRLLDAAGDAPSVELRLRLVRAHLDAGDLAAAEGTVAALEVDEPGDWRLTWFRGVAALLAPDPPAACAAFDAVYATLPGEPAVKLALAAALESGGAPELDTTALDTAALGLYTLVAQTDPAQADAAFGRARIRLRGGDAGGATAALDAVPATSSQHVAAQLSAVDVALAGAAPTGPGQRVAALRSAAARIEALPLDPVTDQRTRASVLSAAVAAAPEDDGGPLLGVSWTERSLRLALEGCLRTSARLTDDPDLRVALIDRANTERPRTWT